MEDANQEVRTAAAGSLGYFKAPFREKAIPLLVRALKEECGLVVAFAAGSLGRIARDARVAIPGLTECLEEDDESIILEALGALALMNPGEEAVPALRRLLSRKELKHDPGYYAVTLLGLIGPAAGSSVPDL